MDLGGNKLLAVLIVSVLVLNIIPSVFSSGKSSPIDPTTFIGKVENNRLTGPILKLFTEGENVDLFQRVAYMSLVWSSMTDISEDIENNLAKYILLNPNLKNPAALNLLRYFVGLLYPVYILAIIVTGFYIVFIPGSPMGRARAKSLLSKLVISMVLVSFSSELMGLLLSLTENSTGEIIGDKLNPKAYVSIAASEFSSMICATRNLVVLANAPNAFYGGVGLLSAFFGGLIKPKGTLEEFGHALHGIELVEIEIVWTTPFVLLLVLILIGIHGMLSIRYFMVFLWGLLLPFTIFLSSFEFTRGFGKTMLEQTLLWASLQVFYGITIVVIAVGISIVPTSMYEAYGIGIHKSDIPLLGSAMDALDIPGEPLFISIFTWTSMFMLLLGPLLMFTFFQKLLPP
ncbi:MAG: hypothetical protein B6U72_01770 [Candidatus Altiarchaeales archaeon ex4484_2]|nr:MAG: hypothetical protein B6U72_01770 [Candidatus Altiarchaeales archaeon ex4484_2]